MGSVCYADTLIADSKSIRKRDSVNNFNLVSVVLARDGIYTHSVPEKDPDPYDTDTAFPVLVLDDVCVYAVFAPTHVFDDPVSISREYVVGGLPTSTVAT